MQLGFELTGTKGSLAYTQERLNELLYFRAGSDPRHSGYTRIEAGPQGVQLGLAHRSLQAEHEPVVEGSRVVEPVRIADQGVGERA